MKSKNALGLFQGDARRLVPLRSVVRFAHRLMGVIHFGFSDHPMGGMNITMPPDRVLIHETIPDRRVNDILQVGFILVD